MDLKSFGKLAAVSAIALGTALYATDVTATLNGAATLVDFNATVDNTFTVTVTQELDLGTIAVLNDSDGDTANYVVDTTGAATDDPGDGWDAGDQASIVWDGVSDPDEAIVDVTNAFATMDMYVTYSGCIDLAGPGAEILEIVEITDDTGGATYDCDTALVTGNQVTTDGAGAVTVSLGVEVQTDSSTDAAYTDGAYLGGVNIHFAY